MSRRAVALPLRLVSSSQARKGQWICRRCLATAATTPSSINNHPPGPPQKDGRPQPAYPTASETEYWPDNVPVPSWYDPTLPREKRINPETKEIYPLRKTDRFLKRPSGEIIPIQYLQHSTSDLLPAQEKEQRARTVAHKEIVGVVVSAGKMDKTVKVRVPGQRWEKKIGKYFSSPTNHLVHDPNSSLVVGDVVKLHRLRVSKAVHHVVAEIVSPFGKPVDARPPIPTPDERLAAWKEHRFAKLKRRSLRQAAAKGNAEAIEELKSMGLVPGDGVEAGKGRNANLQTRDGNPRDSGNGALLGNKGQKLPNGVLPGGKHAVGKVDERARDNMEKVVVLEKKAEDDILDAQGRPEKLRKNVLGVDSSN